MSGKGHGAFTSDTAKIKRIKAYIIREDRPTTREDEDYSEDDDDFDFAGNSVKKFVAHKTKVFVQLLDDFGNPNCMAYINGKFPFIGQWWHIAVDVKTGKDGSMYAQGLPCYRLRSDLSSRGQIFNRMISVVLSGDSDNGNSKEIRIFQSFLKGLNVADYSKLYWLPELVSLIEQCANKQHTEGEKASILRLITTLHKSVPLMEIMFAVENPVTMETLPQLLPRAALSIIRHGIISGSISFKASLEKIVTRSPHELAFKPIIRKKTNVSFSEVIPEGFEKAGLWRVMGQPYKDAVMVYNVLKTHCRGTGDTYISIHRLNGQSPRYGGYTLSVYRAAIDYLKSNGCIIEEDQRVYLKYLYDSETNIARTLSDMISSPEPFTFSVDFESPDLQLLAGDPDQRRAAELISQKPVVVMSGKGGCGKTEVVSRVCRVALLQIYKKKLEEYNEYLKRVMQEQVNRSVAATTYAEGGQSDVSSTKLNDSYCQGSSCDMASSSPLGSPRVVPPCASSNEDLTCQIAPCANTHEDLTCQVAPCATIHEDLTCQTEKSGSNGSQGDLFADSDEDAECSEVEFTSIRGREEEAGSQLADLSTSREADELDDPFNDGEDFDTEPRPPIPDFSHKSYILLTAPTGKAAKVLGKRTGFTGFTLHQIMYRYMLWWKENKTKSDECREEFPFKDVCILVVDECSLVAVGNLSFLLYIMTTYAKLQRIIFLGDIQQLPSIEPGNFLTDVYTALSYKDCSITLRTNHRSEGKLIVENAIRISAQCWPQFDTERNFTIIPLSDSEHMELDRDEAVKNLVKTEAFKCDRVSQFIAFRRIDCEAINNICSKLYTGEICIDPLSKKHMFYEGFKLCCSKNGTVGVIIIHDPCKEAKGRLATESKDDLMSLSGSDIELESAEEKRHRLIQEKVKSYIERAKRQSETGAITDSDSQQIEEKIQNDALLESRKNARQDEVESTKRACEMRLCNGEIFWLKAILEDGQNKGSKAERWIIESEEGLTLSVLKKSLMKECRMKPSWCRTIHTFQGSEIKHLAFVVGAAGRQNWQHVYTAVTRGKSSVVIIGQAEALRKAINTPTQRRFCSLEEKLRALFHIPPQKTNPDCVSRRQLSDGKQPMRRQETPYDELDELLAYEDMIWGDTCTQTQTTNIIHMPAKQETSNAKRRKLHANSTASDIFDELDNFQQMFHNTTQGGASATAPPAIDSVELNFSTEDEDEFSFASQHMDTVEYVKSPLKGTGNNTSIANEVFESSALTEYNLTITNSNRDNSAVTETHTFKSSQVAGGDNLLPSAASGLPPEDKGETDLDNDFRNGAVNIVHCTIASNSDPTSERVILVPVSSEVHL